MPGYGDFLLQGRDPVVTAGACSDVQAVSAEDKEDIARFPFNEEAEIAALGGAKPVGEMGYSTLERRSALCALPPVFVKSLSSCAAVCNTCPFIC